MPRHPVFARYTPVDVELLARVDEAHEAHETLSGPAVNIAERRCPVPKWRPGYLRVDTVHQGHHDGKAGVYHINVVDTVTQWWEVVGCVETIGERHLMPVLESKCCETVVVSNALAPDSWYCRTRLPDCWFSEFCTTEIARCNSWTER